MSREQADARARARAPPPDSPIGSTVELRDYRELDGRFDKIVSIEMLEAVGERYLPAFFATCDRVLAPGGRFGLQTITMPHRRDGVRRRSYTWMQTYIFPGGLIPSLAAIERAHAPTLAAAGDRDAARSASTTRPRCGVARALRRRASTRCARSASTSAFLRMWELYLAYCEAGFRPASSASPSCGWSGA